MYVVATVLYFIMQQTIMLVNIIFGGLLKNAVGGILNW